MILKGFSRHTLVELHCVCAICVLSVVLVLSLAPDPTYQTGLVIFTT